ncbi:MAG TPA: DNA methyltransferase, partial [Acetobacteraceae bacterium]|nr:DNA methyltransferase [Acetobacteraceae bacterium]
ISGASVDPHQFLGLEKNPRAVPVAELVLWIGYLQWHFRTHGNVPPAEPILRDFRNIQQADALLAYADEKPERDKAGQPVSRWDGRTFKTHPVTGEDVPDETARELVLRPVNAEQATWPEADFIVGNPPFIAGKDMRAELGEGYAKALWAAYKDVPRSADIALFFWWKAAQLMRPSKDGAPRRFGFITSNSIRQTFCRRVVAEALQGPRKLRLAFAIPDHPWADGKGAAAVRIAMTVAERWLDRSRPGRLVTVVCERAGKEDAPEVELSEAEGVINADLTIGAPLEATSPLRANEGLCSRGMALHGAGFIISPATARTLGLGRIPELEKHIRPYLNGRDRAQHSRGQMVIDLFGLTEDDVRRRFPAVYQHVLLHVKPERDHNNRPSYRNAWWMFGEPRRELRPALKGLTRYICTVETARHRTFVFLSTETLPDNKLVCIASGDAFTLGVLSSRVHVLWALAAGGWQGVGNDPVYVKTRCFDPFPFPTPTDAQTQTIRELAEELDAHRAARLTAHKHLTLTALYNVLAALRAGRDLTPQERDIHDAGQVSILRTLHDRLDEEVAAAYGWPADLTDADILARLVALNAERRAEEESGLVRWLRPEFQAPDQAMPRAAQPRMAIVQPEATGAPAWPRRAPEQYVALRAALAGQPATPPELARRFAGAPRGRMKDMLDALVIMGQARLTDSGRYVA